MSIFIDTLLINYIFMVQIKWVFFPHQGRFRESCTSPWVRL